MTNEQRSRYMWRIAALLALAALILFVMIGGMKGAFAMFGWFDHSEVEIVLDERFDFEGVRQVKLDVGSLTVEVKTTNEDQARLVFQSNLPPDKRAQLAVERDGDSFTVEQLRHVRIGLFLNVREKLTLYLPAAYQDALVLRLRSGNLTMADARTLSSLEVNVSSGNVELGDIVAKSYDVHASSGNVTLGNWRGQGKIRVTSGNVRLLSLTGEQHEIRSSSGTVRIGSLAGDSLVHVTSGTVRVEHFEGGGSFSSSSGSVNVGITRLTGDVSLQCTSGAVRVTVPSGLAFRFEGESSSGSVRTDFPSTREGRRHTATVGSAPNYTLRCNTTSGSIRVETN